ncbi:MAG: insulinase family protein [Clostridiales bacterium]|nr:insulinase family protein [Clostridiales bacterium]
MVHFKTLPNGIRLVVNEMSSLMSVTMGILVHTGAAYETDKEDGISHFIEHMMFKGTKKRTAFAISDEMDRIGAQMNAFTGKDCTCYYAKSTTAHAAEAFEILADLFLNSTFPEEEAVKEKGVIIEEINMTEDTPDDLCLDILSRAFYGERGYGRNILGTRENVNSFTKTDVDEYMSKYYTTENIVISLAGNIDIKLAEDLALKYFSHLNRKNFDRGEIQVNLAGQALYRKKEIEQIHLAIAFPSLNRNDKLFDATQIMNAILGGSMSSRLFQTVREELGLAYTVYSYVSAYNECGALTVYAGVNSDKYLQSVEAIYKCIEQIKKKTITEDEFIRGKEQLIASSIFSQENTSSQMLLFGKELLYNDKLYNFEERVNRISAVTLNDVFEAIDLNFDEKGKASAIVGAVDKPL